MNHASKLLLLSSLACAVACSVPTLEELDDRKPIEKCSAEHDTCAKGSVCFQERCIPYEGLDCKPGERRACGSSLGECRPGTELCGAEGIFGACEPEVGPVLERCDGKDNDCDGWTDTRVAAIELTRVHDYGSPAAGVAVKRSANDTLGTLLTLSSEEGQLVSRTLSADGTWKVGRTFGLANGQVQFQMPTLAVHGDTVAAAWMAVRPGAQTGTSNYQVLLTLLDGSGAPITEKVINIPHIEPLDPSVPASHLRLAINKTHVLVLIMAGNTSFAVTVSRTLDEATLRGPIELGNVYSGRPLDRWFQASESGAGEEFVVAYEDFSGGTASPLTFFFNTVSLTNDGVLRTPHLITQLEGVHSPFILPFPGDHWQHTVYFAAPGFDSRTPLVTQITSQLCRELGCEPAKSFTQFAHLVRRMQLVAPPGAPQPEVALFKWQDNTRTDPFSLTSVALGGGKAGEVELLRDGPPTLSESLIVMPDSTRYLLFNHSPPPASPTGSSLAVGSLVSEARLLPFCSL